MEKGGEKGAWYKLRASLGINMVITHVFANICLFLTLNRYLF